MDLKLTCLSDPTIEWLELTLRMPLEFDRSGAPELVFYVGITLRESFCSDFGSVFSFLVDMTSRLIRDILCSKSPKLQV